MDGNCLKTHVAYWVLPYKQAAEEKMSLKVITCQVKRSLSVDLKELCHLLQVLTSE